MKFILCDHWTTPSDGWVVLKEQDQDITKKFQWDDNSVDRLFSCHGIEHVDFFGGLNYMRESFRVLKQGGILRTVAPFIDEMVRFAKQKHDKAELYKNYAVTSLAPYYMNEAVELMEMNIKFSNHALPFFFDSLLKKHNHKFVWSSTLMAAVLLKIGFSDVRICLPGESMFDKDTCLERVVRGIDREKFPDIQYFDPESLAVEARK